MNLTPTSIITFDPGGTTGWSCITGIGEYNDDGELVDIFDFTINAGQLDGEHHSSIRLLIQNMSREKTFVISESFEYRNSARYGLDMRSKEYIGIIKLTCKDMAIDYAEQSPSMAKSFVEDKNLKRLGLWFPGKRHSSDALRHLIYALVNRWKLKSLRQTILETGYA